MNPEILVSVYEENEVVRAICAHMSQRSKNQNETTLHRMAYHLQQEGYDFKKSELIAAFRKLEEAECGRYVEGRHGWKSRFVWSIKSMLVDDVANGVDSAEDIDDIADEIECDNEEMIEHVYVLRPDLTVTIELPADLSQKEADRLSRFIDSLSFEGDSFC